MLLTLNWKPSGSYPARTPVIRAIPLFGVSLIHFSSNMNQESVRLWYLSLYESPFGFIKQGSLGILYPQMC